MDFKIKNMEKKFDTNWIVIGAATAVTMFVWSYVIKEGDPDGYYAAVGATLFTVGFWLQKFNKLQFITKPIAKFFKWIKRKP